MFLAEKRRHPSPLSLLLHPRTRKAPNPNPNPNPNPSARSFDLALALGLRSLLPLAPAPLPLSWLARATDLLASTLADAVPLLSRPSPSSSSSSSSDPAALAAHLRSGLALLDTANSLSAALHLLLRRRLLLRLRLSSSPSPDSLRLAIAEWDRAPPITIPHTFPAAAPQPPRPSASAARRAIYAADAVAALVLPAIAAALGGAGAGAIAAESTPPLPRVPAELPWAAEFNELAEEIPLKLRAGLAAEIEAVDDAVRRLTAVVDGDGDVDPEKLRHAAEEAVTLTEEMTEGLDRLSDAVNGLFRAAMLARNAALDTFRIGPQKCRQLFSGP